MFSLLIFLTLITSLNASCPNGSIEWQTNCYFFQSNQTAFVVAEETCNSLGGHLVSIHDGFTNSLIAQNAGLKFHESTVIDFWIGGSDLISPGNWSWTDGSNFTFTNWNHSKNTSGEDCLAQSISDGRWNAEDCFKPKPFVCAVSAIPTNPPFVDCGRMWIYLESTGYCYGGVTAAKKYDWHESQSLCEQLGGNLFSIHNDNEWDLLYTLTGMSYYSLWIGLYSIDNEKSWLWSDKTPVNYFKWYSGNPKLNTSSCAFFAGGFQDNDCSTKLYPVCKRKP